MPLLHSDDSFFSHPVCVFVAGGITISNAQKFIDAGASHVIVTSYVFRDGVIDFARLQELVDTIGRKRLVSAEFNLNAPLTSCRS